MGKLCPFTAVMLQKSLQRSVDFGRTQTSLHRRGMQLIAASMKCRRPELVRSVESHHDHERIRGKVPVPRPITASNLRCCPPTQPDRTTATLLGCFSGGWYDHDDMQGSIGSHPPRRNSWARIAHRFTLIQVFSLRDAGSGAKTANDCARN